MIDRRAPIQVAVLAVVTVLMAACGGSSSSGTGKAPTGPIAVGELMPVTGRAANPGARFLNGVKVGVSVVNSNGGVLGQPFQEYLGDTASDAVDGVAAFRQLQTHNVAAIWGSTSIEQPGLQAIVDASQVPQLALIAGTLYDNRHDKWTYRIGSPDSALAKGMVYYAIKNGWTKCVMIFENTQSAQSFVEPISTTFKNHGGTVLSTMAIVPHQSSYRTEITTAFATNPQCVFIQTDPQTSGTFYGNARELGHFNVPYIGSDQYTDPTIGKAAGLADASKWMTGITGAQPSGSAFNTFAQKYQSMFNAAPDTFSADFYDAVVVTALAMTAAGTADPKVWVDSIATVTGNEKGQEVSDYAEAVKLIKQGKQIDYEGASGNMDWDATHTMYQDLQVVHFDTSGNTQSVFTVPASGLLGY